MCQHCIGNCALQYHRIFNYNYKFYRCNNHGEKYIEFCEKCQQNLCNICFLEHYPSHKILYHKDILKNNNMDHNLLDLSKHINDFKNEMERIISEYNKKVSKFYKIKTN